MGSENYRHFNGVQNTMNSNGTIEPSGADQIGDSSEKKMDFSISIPAPNHPSSQCPSPDSGYAPFITRNETQCSAGRSTVEDNTLISKNGTLCGLCKSPTAIAIASAILALICLAVLFLHIFVFQPVMPKRPDVCILCSDISPTSDVNHRMLRNFRRKEEEGRLYCCIDSGDQFVDLVGVVNERDQRTDKTLVPRGPTENRKGIAAHVVMDGRGDPHDKRLVRWSSDTSPSHISKELTFNKTHIVVPENGLYVIYSHVIFVIPNEDVTKEVFHLIKRANRSYKRRDVLLKNEVQFKENGRTVDPSHIGGVIKLRANDEIFVEVSNTTFLYNPMQSEGIASFGLYRI